MIDAEDLRDLITIVRPEEAPTLEELAAQIANLFLIVAGLIAFIYLIYAGVLYITAGGNNEQAQRAQRAFINVIIGIVIIVLSYFIIRFVTGAIVEFFS
ncbi:MAG: hypothetical protein AAB360_02650 [Patescibacteria group bacterium]